MCIISVDNCRDMRRGVCERDGGFGSRWPYWYIHTPRKKRVTTLFGVFFLACMSVLSMAGILETRSWMGYPEITGNKPENITNSSFALTFGMVEPRVRRSQRSRNLLSSPRNYIAGDSSS